MTARRVPSPVVLATVFLSTAAVVSPSYLVSAAAPLLPAAFGLDTARVGIAVSCFFAASAVFAAPAGRLADAYGSRMALSVGVVAGVAGVAGIAAAPPRYAVLLALLLLAGAGNGMTQPAGNVAVEDYLPPARRGFAFGIKQAAVPAANLGVGLLVAIVVRHDWRAAFAAVAAAIVVAGMLVRMLPAGRPPHDPGPTAAWTDTGGADAARTATAGTARGEPEAAGTAMARTGTVARGRGWLALLTCGAFCGAAANTMLGSFLVISLVHHGVDPGRAGLLFAVGAGMCVLVRTTAGWLVRRDGLRVVAALMLVGTPTMTVIGLADSPDAVALAGVAAMGVGWGWQGVFAHTVATLGAGRPGTVTGTTHAGIFVGGTIGPPVFGLVATHSFPVAWSLAAGSALVAAIAVLAGRRLADSGGTPVRADPAAPPTPARR